MTPEQIALERYQIIRPCLLDGASKEEIAKASGITSRTIRLWVCEFERKGLSGLMPKPRKDKGARRAVEPELVRVIEGICLRKPPLPISAIHRTVENLCKRNNWRIPSYDVVHDIASRIAPDLKVLAHEGPSAYEQTFDLLHRYEAEMPNELWQADHAQLPIHVLDSSGRTVKPWLTAILDDYSRVVPGYYLAVEPPSAMRIALALRQAVWRKSHAEWTACGIPDKFYSDRGTDFTSQHMDQISIELKFELLQTLPQKPKGKGKVERFFETVDQLFLTGQPGYAPKGSSKIEPILNVEELDNRFCTWLIEEYQTRIHSETGLPPKVRWESSLFIPRLPESKEDLDILLLTVAKPRMVQRDGIRFQGLRYFDVALAGHIGEEVTIRYDPRDLSQILVYANDALLCRAACFELTDTKPSLKEIVRARNNRRREVKEVLSDLLGAADRHVPIERPVSKTITNETELHQANFPKFKIKRFACDDD